METDDGDEKKGVVRKLNRREGRNRTGLPDII